MTLCPALLSRAGGRLSRFPATPYEPARILLGHPLPRGCVSAALAGSATARTAIRAGRRALYTKRNISSAGQERPRELRG
jgi:hypothetical protein